MQCPMCSAQTRVRESRSAQAGRAVRRRRECSACGHRFTTYERHEEAQLYVRKRDGQRQPFDRQKLHFGLARAAHKRPVSRAQIDAIVEGIAAEIRRGGGELPAQRIGEMCLDALRRIDRISYLQFASIYRAFADIDEIGAELARLRADKGEHSPVSPRQSSDFAETAATGSVRTNEDPAQLPRNAR